MAMVALGFHATVQRVNGPIASSHHIRVVAAFLKRCSGTGIRRELSYSTLFISRHRVFDSEYDAENAHRSYQKQCSLIEEASSIEYEMKVFGLKINWTHQRRCKEVGFFPSILEENESEKDKSEFNLIEIFLSPQSHFLPASACSRLQRIPSRWTDVSRLAEMNLTLRVRVLYAVTHARPHLLIKRTARNWGKLNIFCCEEAEKRPINLGASRLVNEIWLIAVISTDRVYLHLFTFIHKMSPIFNSICSVKWMLSIVVCIEIIST